MNNMLMLGVMIGSIVGIVLMSLVNINRYEAMLSEIHRLQKINKNKEN